VSVAESASVNSMDKSDGVNAPLAVWKGGLEMVAIFVLLSENHCNSMQIDFKIRHLSESDLVSPISSD
jgi:hypothetical protein